MTHHDDPDDSDQHDAETEEEATPKEQQKAFKKSFKAMRRQNKTDVAAHLARGDDQG